MSRRRSAAPPQTPAPGEAERERSAARARSYWSRTEPSPEPSTAPELRPRTTTTRCRSAAPPPLPPPVRTPRPRRARLSRSEDSSRDPRPRRSPPCRLLGPHPRPRPRRPATCLASSDALATQAACAGLSPHRRPMEGLMSQSGSRCRTTWRSPRRTGEPSRRSPQYWRLTRCWSRPCGLTTKRPGALDTRRETGVTPPRERSWTTAASFRSEYRGPGPPVASP